MGIKNHIRHILSVVSMTMAVLTLTGCGMSQRQQQIEYISEKYSVKNDNQLILYTSHKEEVYLPIVREFENRTGIWVEVHAGGTAEMMQKAREASQKGECDIMFGGGIESYEAQSDLFLSYVTSQNEDLDQNYLASNGSWTAFTELPIVFIYNKKLVSASEVPRDWNTLLKDQRWKGKVAFADLSSSGTSYTIVSTMEQVLDKPYEEVLPQLCKQLDGQILQSSGDIIPKVSDGSYLIGITLEETARKYIANGYNISMVYPSDGTSAVPDGCAMLKNAPHSYNAGKFIDFVVGYDTQKYVSENFYRRPVRTDIDLSSMYGEVTLISFDIKKAAKEEDDIFKLWYELTGEEGDENGDH